MSAPPCRAGTAGRGRASLLRAVALVLATVSASGGCGEPTAPAAGLSQADFVGTYRLASIGGQPLPARLGTSAFVVYAQLFEFRADSTYREFVVDGRFDEARRDTSNVLGRWVFRPQSFRGQDAVWQDPGYQGTARGVQFPLKIRDGGRTLYIDEYYDSATPRPAWVYEKQ